MGSVCLGPLPMDHPFRDIAAGFGSAVFERQCHQANLRPKFFKSELQASQVCKKFCMTLYSQAQCLAMSPFALLLCLPLCSGSSDNPHESGGMHLFDMLVVTVLILLLTSSVLIVKVLGARDSKGSSKVLLRDAGVQCSLSKEAHGVSSSSRACHQVFRSWHSSFSFDYDDCDYDHDNVPRSQLNMLAFHSTVPPH